MRPGARDEGEPFWIKRTENKHALKQEQGWLVLEQNQASASGTQRCEKQ
jgi:hypothetical protein